jgi:chromosome segregation ATPase
VEQALAQLHLVLRQGDPLGALVGLGPWLSQLNTVQLILPWPEETMRLVETWLAEHGFRQDLQAATMWRLDLISKGDLLLKEKENQKQALLTANQQLNSACEAMRAEKELLVAKLEEISTLSQEAREAQNLALEDVQKSHIEAEKLKNNQESLRQELQQLHSEKSELLQKLQAEKATSYNIRESLKSLFPMQLYREENIDLRSHDEDNLVLHYVEFGRKEGRLKAYQELDAELKSSIKQNDEAEAKLERLEEQFRLAKEQIEALKDVFSRLADRQQYPRHQKKR